MIRLVAIDIDGTLLDDNGNIPISNLQAIQKASKEYGAKIVLCTGRGVSAFEIAKKLNVDCSLILANGVYIYNHIFEPPIIKNYLDYELKTKILNFLEENIGLDYYVVLGFEEDFHMVYKQRKKYDSYFLGFVKGRELFKPTYPANRLIDYAKRPISHIGIVGEYEKLQDIKQMLKDLRDYVNLILYYASDNKNYGFLEILNINSSKEKALLKFSEINNIKSSEIITVGDNFNDMGMFNISGISVAVANAPEEVKKPAMYITKNTNNEGAVAEVLERFIFKRDG